MNKKEKANVVTQVAELLEGAQGIFSVDFTGLNVARTIELRREFKKAGVSYKVAKNTLIKRALKDKGGYDHIVDLFKGQTGIAIGYDDPAAPARILKGFVKDDMPKLNFATIEGEIFDGGQLAHLASMPTKKDLLGSIVGALNAPASGIVGAINAVMRDLSSVIEAVAKSKE
jgi:large subunit ribosomal protein L10